MKNDVFGYILMENSTEHNEISNVDVVKNNGLFFVRFDTVLQSLNVENRNRRWYAADAIMKALGSEKIQELIRQGRFEGEAGHPITDNIARVSTVDPARTCHKITKFWLDGNLLKGTIETLDDGMLGTKLTKRILQSGTGSASFSLRALARLDKSKGVSYVRQEPHIVTFDEVQLPSHKEAYGILGTEKKIIKDIYGKEITMESGSIAITANDVKSYVMEKSENLNIICESFNINPDSIKIMENGRRLSVAQNGSGERYVFAMEQNVFDNIRDYWISL